MPNNSLAVPDAPGVSSLHIRCLLTRDMPEVMAIERDSFEFPWIDTDFRRCLRQHNVVGMVAEIEDRVAGYMLYELHRFRLEVLTFAVGREWQRRGVGSQMVRFLVGKLCPQERRRIRLIVRETNLPAQRFFQRCGFLAVNVLRDYYEDKTEDAYVMQYQASDSAGRINRP